MNQDSFVSLRTILLLFSGRKKEKKRKEKKTKTNE